MQVPSGAELARPFVPAKDFALSRRFYEALGFTKLLEIPEVVIFAVGSSSFLLQKHYQKEWAENFMMQLMVDDLDGWWDHIQSLNLPASSASPHQDRRLSSLGVSGSLTSSIPRESSGTWRNGGPE